MAFRFPLPALLPDALAAEDDRALVRRYAESRDEAAFAAVMSRHARMVYGVCRRAVRDAHLAEDAFQAVFLVLAHHPARAAHTSAVGGWLFGVARRVGLAARRRELRQSRRNAAASPRQEASPDFDDLHRVLDEELAALPEELRAPLVACFLEERTLDEAARHLGWSVSTLRRRLDRAKELLRSRLTRRGATLAAGLFAGFLARSAAAAMPARLIDSAFPGANPSPLAALLAAESCHSWVFQKAGLAAMVVALGLGGAAMGLNTSARENGTPPADQTRSATLGGDIAVAPAPRPADRPWTTVRGQVVFPPGRSPPAIRAVPPNTIKDFGFFGFQHYRDVLVDPESRGIANVVVWLRPDVDREDAVFQAGSIHPELQREGPREHFIRAAPEGFVPRITAARAGDRLVFSNPTPVPFTVNYQRPAKPDQAATDPVSEFNVLLPPGRSHTTRPLPALENCDTVTDNIHHWVEARVWAFEHPYFAVTDANGRFSIPSAPTGTWRLVVWHEKAGFAAPGRLGARIEIAPGGRLTPLSLESPRWGERP